MDARSSASNISTPKTRKPWFWEDLTFRRSSSSSWSFRSCSSLSISLELNESRDSSHSNELPKRSFGTRGPNADSSRLSIEFLGYVLTFNKRKYELWKLYLNSPVCRGVVSTEFRPSHTENGCAHLLLSSSFRRSSSRLLSSSIRFSSNSRLSKICATRLLSYYGKVLELKKYILPTFQRDNV